MEKENLAKSTNQVDGNNGRKERTAIFIIEAILILIIIIVSGIAIHAWAKYLSSKSEGAQSDVAKWYFKIKNVNGQTMESGTINFPVTRLDNNRAVKSGELAPGTYGVFQVIIDTTGTEVSLRYDVEVTLHDCPQNLVFYRITDENYSPEVLQSLANINDSIAGLQNLNMTKLSKNNNLLKIERFLPIKGAEKLAGGIYRETIYWVWPFENGEGENEIYQNDLQDTEDMNDDFTMDISVSGWQVDPRTAP